MTSMTMTAPLPRLVPRMNLATGSIATIGGTGLGQIAVIYGHQRSNGDITWICVFLTVLIVQLIQIIGTAVERKTDKRIK